MEIDAKTKRVIREFVVEHFLRRLDLSCPRCGKKFTIQFSLEKGPTAEYEEEKHMVSIKTNFEKESGKVQLPIVVIPPGMLPQATIDAITKAMMKAMKEGKGR